MKRTVFSRSWHLVAELKPKLLPHTRIDSHNYRGKHWYVVSDSISGRYHRLTPDSYEIISKMNGIRKVQELWDESCKVGGDDIPTQDEMVQLLMQLHSNDLLHCDVTPDSAELFERYSKRKRQKWKQIVTQPLSVKVPLFNPDKLLSRWVHHFNWVFSTLGVLLWLAVVFPALLLAGQHWNELTMNISDQVLSSGNLFALALIFPFVKAIHELAHGFATKAWGGSVNEMGVMFLVFAPVPFVDASSASAFRSKYRRAVVGAAGMLAEVFIASLAMYVWLLVEPGVVRAIAFNVMLIAGVSTVIVNANPLLRYDGYFILSDLIEIPNLAQRGQKYLVYLSDRYLFGAKELDSPIDSRSEKTWFVVYTVSSWIYRMLIMVSIILFVAGKFFIFGVILAMIGLFGLVIKPLWKGGKHLLESPSLHRYRTRAIKSTIGFITLLFIFLTMIPMPLKTQSEGVVWLSDNAQIRAQENGLFQRWLVAPGTKIKKGEPLLVMDNPELENELKVADARVGEFQARYAIKQFTSPVEASVLKQQLDYEKRSLEQVKRRVEQLIVHSNVDGVLAVQKPQDMQGQYFKKGELLGFVVDSNLLVARVAVSQDNIGLVRNNLKATELRYVDAVSHRYHVPVLREIPSGLQELPTAALSPAGGGTIPVDPGDNKGLKTLDRYFFVDVGLPKDALPNTFGGRVFVRFSHHDEPLLGQAFRRIRQLLLSRFNV
jgi:putative peptide zinc metalloprotease protein